MFYETSWIKYFLHQISSTFAKFTLRSDFKLFLLFELKTGKNFSFLHYTADHKVSLKPNHNYMYQIQGQLAISKKKICYFVVYTFKDLFIEKVAIDEFFFTNEILPKTKNFYENFYRPHVASKL